MVLAMPFFPVQARRRNYMIFSIALMFFHGAGFANAIPAAIARPAAASITVAGVPSLLSSLPDTSPILIKKSSSAKAAPETSADVVPQPDPAVPNSRNGGIAPH